MTNADKRLLEAAEKAKVAGDDLLRAERECNAQADPKRPDATVSYENRADACELADHLTSKIDRMLSGKYTNTFRIVHGIIEQELAPWIAKRDAQVEARARLAEFDYIINHRPAYPPYWDMHHRRELESQAHPSRGEQK